MTTSYRVGRASEQIECMLQTSRHTSGMDTASGCFAIALRRSRHTMQQRSPTVDPPSDDARRPMALLLHTLDSHPHVRVRRQSSRRRGHHRCVTSMPLLLY